MGYPTRARALRRGAFTTPCSAAIRCGLPSLTGATSSSTCCSRWPIRPSSTPKRPSRPPSGCTRQVRGPPRPNRAGADRDARVGHADHRQTRAAPQSGRPRPLPSIHGRRCPVGRHAIGGALPGRIRRRPADRPAARKDGGGGKPPILSRLSRPRQSGASPTPCKSSSPTAARRHGSKSSIRWAIAAVGPRRYRSWSRSSGQRGNAPAGRPSASPCSNCSAMARRLESLPVDQFMAMFAVLRE